MSDRSEQLTRLRRADSKAKATRVLTTLETMAGTGESLALAAVARRAGVSRRFIYDHPELRAEAELRSAELAAKSVRTAGMGALVTTASLRADLENERARSHRLEIDLASLKRRLGEALGRDILADEGGAGSTGLAHITDARLAELEQALFEAEEALARRTEELEAARQINRELMGRMNKGRG